MDTAKTLRIASLAAGILITSCMQHQSALPDQLTSAGTITFRNQSRDRVQVYLVSDTQDWLLGRLEPLETAHLRLPESESIAAGEAVVLAVVPGWSRNLAPRRDLRSAISLTEFSRNLPGEKWIFVNGQLQGPR